MCHYWHAQPSEGYLLAKIINTKIVGREGWGEGGGEGGRGSQGLSNEFAAMRSEAGQCALKGVKAVSMQILPFLIASSLYSNLLDRSCLFTLRTTVTRTVNLTRKVCYAQNQSL